MTKHKWILAAGVLALIVVASLSHRPKPEPISPVERRKILEELVAADPWVGGLTPNHLGDTLAYLVETEVGRRVTLLNLQTLEKRTIPTTNEVKTIFGWSADDRYLAFSQMHPEPVSLRQATSKAVGIWLTLYDRRTEEFKRLTEETNVVDVKFFWLANETFLIASRPVSNSVPEFTGWMLGSLQEPYRARVSTLIPELSVITEGQGVFGTDDLSTLELKPLKRTETGWDEASRVVEKISDFKTNGFSGLQWVNYSAANSNFLFCSRPRESNWRYLYQFNPSSQRLTQLSTEDTYNGQWLLGGEGYAYVINTNDSFHLAVRLASGEGNTNLFKDGSVEVYKATSAGDKIYTVASLGYEPHGIWEYTVTNQRLRKVVEGNSRPFESSQVVQPRTIALKSFDGVVTPCIFFSPVQRIHPALAPQKFFWERFRPEVKYPAVIYVPPGSSQFQRKFDRQAQIFANLGFYYAVINYRGCDGYGAEYKNLANSADAARDVLNLYEKLAAEAEVDAKNIFLITASAGMAVVSELLAMRPDLWRGVVLDKPGSGPPTSRLEPSRLPPTLMVMGGMDKGYDAMNAFVTWAKTNQVDIQSLVFTNGEHGTFNLSERKETLQTMAEFFIGHLK